jgi:mRNA-degrading endonuclease RelE of RelBE toxin-antitoxin system
MSLFDIIKNKSYTMSISWNIRITKAAIKQASKLNTNISLALRFLLEDLTLKGPAIPEWPNYGKLHGIKNKDKYHCHLKKGKPTYVCCWELKDKKRKIIEVYYVGTHEKAPY